MEERNWTSPGMLEEKRVCQTQETKFPENTRFYHIGGKQRRGDREPIAGPMRGSA